MSPEYNICSSVFGKETCFTLDKIDHACTNNRSLSWILAGGRAERISIDAYLGLEAAALGLRRRLLKMLRVVADRSRRRGERSARRCLIEPVGEDLSESRAAVLEILEERKRSVVDVNVASNNFSAEMIGGLGGLFQIDDCLGGGVSISDLMTGFSGRGGGQSDSLMRGFSGTGGGLEGKCNCSLIEDFFSGGVGGNGNSSFLRCFLSGRGLERGFGSPWMVEFSDSCWEGKVNPTVSPARLIG